MTFDNLLGVIGRDSVTDVVIKLCEKVKFEGSVAVEVVAVPEIEWLETRISSSEKNCTWKTF